MANTIELKSKLKQDVWVLNDMAPRKSTITSIHVYLNSLIKTECITTIDGIDREKYYIDNPSFNKCAAFFTEKEMFTELSNRMNGIKKY